MSPLRRFILTAAFWLPAMFFLWYVLSSAVVYPVIRLTAVVFSLWMPDLLLEMGQDYHQALYAYAANVSGVPGLPAAKLAVEEQRTNVLIYCYGVPLLFGLVMATPLNWRRTWLQLGIGFAVLTAMETFGLVGEVLKTMAFGVRAAIEAALGAMQYAHIAAPAGAAAEQNMHLALAQHGLSIDGIGLMYQFGYLVLPAVVPVALWIVMNRSFLESLVGWSGEPGGEAAGPRDGSAGTASGGKNA